MQIRQAIAAASIACGFAAGGPGLAGELLPYPAPPPTASVPVYPGPAQRPAYPSSAPSAVPLETYLRFQAEAAKLPPSERQGLARKFEDSRASARQAHDFERENHYMQLIRILQDTR